MERVSPAGAAPPSRRAGISAHGGTRGRLTARRYADGERRGRRTPGVPGADGAGAVLVGQPVSVGVGSGLYAVGDAGLGEDVADVPLDGVIADEERVGDLAVALTLRQQTQHLHLASGEAVRINRRVAHAGARTAVESC